MKKKNGYFQVVMFRADGSWADTRKYKTLSGAVKFGNSKALYGYTSKVTWVNLNEY